MKSKILKAFATATAVLGASHVIVQADDKTTTLQNIENPFQDLTDDADLMKRAIETIMEHNFPELFDEKYGADIAIAGPASSIEVIKEKVSRDEDWDKEDICALYHLPADERLAFFKQLEKGKIRIPFFNDEAVLLTNGMSKEQIKEFCQINMNQISPSPRTVGELIDSVLEIYQSPEPLYNNTPKPLLKHTAFEKKPPRINRGR